MTGPAILRCSCGGWAEMAGDGTGAPEFFDAHMDCPGAVHTMIPAGHIRTETNRMMAAVLRHLDDEVTR